MNMNNYVSTQSSKEVNLMEIRIDTKLIGAAKPCFIIAEAGVNHNGSLRLAKELIDAAKVAGADAVKFQTFKSEDLVTDSVDTAGYQQKKTGKKQKQLKMLKSLELDYSDFIDLKKYCDRKKIIFLSTPHSENALEFLDPLVPCFKIASGDLTNLPFLEKVAKKKKPVILSTGIATLQETVDAVKVIKNTGNKRIILLHCTTNYPCPLGEVNLKAMETLKHKFGCIVGYSDHTEGLLVPIMAVTLGAKVLEKHFTLDKNLPGPDHKASIETDKLKEMVKTIREVEKALGDGIKKPTKSEGKIKKVIRKSIVANRDIKKGEVFTGENLSVKRPGTGIKPKYLNKILGKTAKEDIRKDELIAWNKI